MWTITVNSATTAGMGKEKHHGDSRGRDGAQPLFLLFGLPSSFFQAFYVAYTRLLNKGAHSTFAGHVLLSEQATKSKTQQQREGLTSSSYLVNRGTCSLSGTISVHRMESCDFPNHRLEGRFLSVEKASTKFQGWADWYGRRKKYHDMSNFCRLRSILY